MMLESGCCVVVVAVVVAFFICWAPFHAQRLMTIYIREDQWTPLWLELQSHLFYISGSVCFLSLCTVLCTLPVSYDAITVQENASVTDVGLQ